MSVAMTVASRAPAALRGIETRPGGVSGVLAGADPRTARLRPGRTQVRR